MTRLRSKLEFALWLLLTWLMVRLVVRCSGHWPAWQLWPALVLGAWGFAAMVADDLAAWAAVRQAEPEQPTPQAPRVRQNARRELRGDEWHLETADGYVPTGAKTRRLIDDELGRPPQ